MIKNGLWKPKKSTLIGWSLGALLQEEILKKIFKSLLNHYKRNNDEDKKGYSTNRPA